ncbi:MAG: T9SS type A sorting domain-containing protein, partial [Spirosomaceae bacterium]|nr:T9SS type A sorting domain-containing protein [Spirosomataceae bacterium]
LSPDKQVLVYPNPADEQKGFYLTIEYVEDETIQIFNSNGILVLKAKANGTTNYINAQSLAAGTYFCKVGTRPSIRIVIR